MSGGSSISSQRDNDIANAHRANHRKRTNNAQYATAVCSSLWHLSHRDKTNIRLFYAVCYSLCVDYQSGRTKANKLHTFTTTRSAVAID